MLATGYSLSRAFFNFLFFIHRRVFMMSYHALRCGKSSAQSTAHQLKTIKAELGDAEEGAPDPCPEVVVHDNLDAQSQILCGISKV